jgi:hypothetical protein
MKKIINENNLIEIINDKKIKNWIKIKYILNFNDKINITGISKLLNITRMAVYKSIVLHNLNYDKTKRKRNVVLFKEKLKEIIKLI